MEKTTEENLYGLGCELVEDDERNFGYHNIAVGGVIDLPDEFEVETPHTYQGSIDSCVGQAVAGAKSTQENDPKSPRFLWSLCKRAQKYKGWGTNVPLALKMLQKIGVPKLSTISEDPKLPRETYMRVSDNSAQSVYDEAAEAKSDSYWYVYSKNLQLVKQALFTEKIPLVTTMMWYKEYNQPIDGFLPRPKNEAAGHGFRFVGWKKIGDRYRWKFKNSFREEWGVEKGCFYIWEDELNSIYNIGTFFITVDIPKEEASIMDKYAGELIKNADDAKVFFVQGRDIVWIQSEDTFNFGKNKMWGDWNDILTVPEELKETKKLSLNSAS
ncbi:hypothetical protein DRQ25_00840 [Candidatus Fermentibacteria bacterium]|nr:MAG: hypothetical protein DRQ25_00840 [Candidatus Fermentibacteria bacterium]